MMRWSIPHLAARDREYIKHQVEEGGPTVAKSSLFMLRDELIVGCPPGKDLARDDGFEAGLPF